MELEAGFGISDHDDNHRRSNALCGMEQIMIRFIFRAIGYWLLVSATMLFVHFVASTI